MNVWCVQCLEKVVGVLIAQMILWCNRLCVECLACAESVKQHSKHDTGSGVMDHTGKS